MIASIGETPWPGTSVFTPHGADGAPVFNYRWGCFILVGSFGDCYNRLLVRAIDDGISVWSDPQYCANLMLVDKRVVKVMAPCPRDGSA